MRTSSTKFRHNKQTSRRPDFAAEVASVIVARADTPLLQATDSLPRLVRVRLYWRSSLAEKSLAQSKGKIRKDEQFRLLAVPLERKVLGGGVNRSCDGGRSGVAGGEAVVQNALPGDPGGRVVVGELRTEGWCWASDSAHRLNG